MAITFYYDSRSFNPITSLTGVSTSATTETTGIIETTATTSEGNKIKRTDTLMGVIAGETSKAASAVPAGPGRRQLVGV